MNAILVVSHGSRYPQTKTEVAALCEKLQKANADDLVAYAFLELENPSIPDAIDACVEKGAGRVIVLLNFLNSGKHVDEDIPAIIKAAQTKYPVVPFFLSRPIGLHPDITALFQETVTRLKKI